LVTKLDGLSLTNIFRGIPKERTLLDEVGMSQRCRQPTYALHHTAPSSSVRWLLAVSYFSILSCISAGATELLTNLHEVYRYAGSPTPGYDGAVRGAEPGRDLPPTIGDFCGTLR